MDQQPEEQPQVPQSQPQPPTSDLPVVPMVSETEQPAAQASLPAEELPDASQQTPEPISGSMGRPQQEQGFLEWQASEYVEHEKSAKWFVILALVAVVLAALAVFFLKNYTFALLIIVMAVAVAVWAKRSAHEMYYKLETATIWVNDKPFSLHDFRAFGLMQDGAVYTVTLVPNKRFSPGVTVYFPHELGEQIVDVLGASLPMEDMQPDWIDKLTRKLNF